MISLYQIGKMDTSLMSLKPLNRIVLITDCYTSFRITKEQLTIASSNTCYIHSLFHYMYTDIIIPEVYIDYSLDSRSEAIQKWKNQISSTFDTALHNKCGKMITNTNTEEISESGKHTKKALLLTLQKYISIHDILHVLLLFSFLTCK